MQRLALVNFDLRHIPIHTNFTSHLYLEGWRERGNKELVSELTLFPLEFAPCLKVLRSYHHDT